VIAQIRYLVINVVETLLRMVPIRTRTGLIRIGQPDRNSPVLLTCNFHLTVARVKRALRGIDAYLLVANSRGVNVWCAATGGLFTNHDVISVLKTSGVEKLVDHRSVILPQLAATGIERKLIRKKTGWIVKWGPVEARDIPAYLHNPHLPREQRTVTFPPGRRFEMAVAWASPISVVAGVILLLVWPAAILPTLALIWGLSLLIFMTFPWYERWLNPKGRRVGFIVFDFGRGGFQLLLFGLVMLGLVVVGHQTGQLTGGFLLRWGVVALAVVAVLSMDLMGSTPLYKSGLHADRLLEVQLDEERCRGAGFCEQVCPRDCFEVDRRRHKATRPRADLCVQCGACLVQCPFDALAFAAPDGRIVPPETVRRYKLNLMGHRLIPAGE
jgi:NAD-dependent dihydropyrimidine dehydrogenase PreA subunit